MVAAPRSMYTAKVPDAASGSDAQHLRDSGTRVFATNYLRGTIGFGWRLGPAQPLRKRRGSGDSPGLQNRRLAPCGVNGAFDSHTLPPSGFGDLQVLAGFSSHS